MLDASCRRDDIIAAFEDLCHRLAERRAELWGAYVEATGAMTRREYEEQEPECWSVLEAALGGIAAEERMLRRDRDRRIHQLEGEGAVA